jgi:hypothetical protein
MELIKQRKFQSNLRSRRELYEEFFKISSIRSRHIKNVLCMKLVECATWKIFLILRSRRNGSKLYNYLSATLMLEANSLSCFHSTEFLTGIFHWIARTWHGSKDLTAAGWKRDYHNWLVRGQNGQSSFSCCCYLKIPNILYNLQK